MFNVIVSVYLGISILNLLLFKFVLIKKAYQREKEYMEAYDTECRIT